MPSLLRIEELLKDGIRRRVFPCAAYAFGTGGVIFSGSVGKLTYEETSHRASIHSLFDLASVTKVVGTTSAAMILWQRGLLDLDEPVVNHLDMVDPRITPRHLLTHSSGLISHRRYDELFTVPLAAWQGILREKPQAEPGTRFEYSCVGFLMLYQLIVKIIMRENYDPEDTEHQARVYNAFLFREIFKPLRMDNVVFNPTYPRTQRCVPTEIPIGSADPICGEVHDENCRFLGGIAGNAGLFGNVEDMARFCSIILLGGAGVFAREALLEWTRVQNPALSTRALGWDTRSLEGSSAGTRFSPRSFGHTGFTGTSLWIDPDKAIYAVLLTNRVHPRRENEQLTAFRPQFYDLVASILSED